MNKIKRSRNAFLFLAALLALAGIYFINSTKLSASSHSSLSGDLSVGSGVSATHKLKARQGPSLTSAPFGFQNKLARGKIVGGPVFADGYWWWLVDYNNAPDGWSAENYLERSEPISFSYSRSPSGAMINNPVTVTISAASVEDLNIGESSYWGLYVGQWPDNSIGAFSECVPRTTLSYSFAINLPLGEYSEVDLMADMTPEMCANGNADIAYNVEGDGSGAIFKVVGN